MRYNTLSFLLNFECFIRKVRTVVMLAAEGKE